MSMVNEYGLGKMSWEQIPIYLDKYNRAKMGSEYITIENSEKGYAPGLFNGAFCVQHSYE